MVFEGAVISHIGCRRENNEDNYYLNGIYKQDVQQEIVQFAEPQAERQILAGVFDGAGGAAYGERAALMAVTSLAEYQEGLSSKRIVNEYIPHVNELIIKEINKIGDKMGTTLAMLSIDGEMANVYNLGDSRVYLFREQNLMQITYDHTQKRRKHLTKYLGMRNQEGIKPYFMEQIPVREQDIFILCTDGLYNMVSEEMICRQLNRKREQAPLEIARTITAEALLAGGKDNITCMVIKAEIRKEG